jgi:GT2 family glycosyltransferase
MPIKAPSATPRVSVIIPSLDGHRGGAVPRLLRSLHEQSFQDFETHVVKGVRPQGRALNQGARAARGSVLIIVDDDACLADPHVLERLLDVLERDPAIGMAGASIVVGPDATPFQRRAACQFPRFNMPVVDEVTESDMACHGCCAIPARVYWEIGGEREDIVRGLDPDLRVRLRDKGYRVVLAPNTRIYHPLPDGWRALLRIFFRNGFGSAYALKYQAESVYETDEKVDARGFKPRTSLGYRILRFPGRLALAFLRGQEMRFAAYTAYAAGYLWGMASAQPISKSEDLSLREGPG